MFQINQDYRRSDLHDRYGGNRQGGIANCANYPYIFIFTGSAGEQHGYEDGWSEKNLFYYTGEGQVGDMEFSRGNKALLDHLANGKKVFLFEQQGNSLWKYIDELELVDYQYFKALDTNSQPRRAIRFILKSKGGASTTPQGDNRKSPNYNKPNKTERKGLVTSRVGQGYYRNLILERWEGKCAVTGCNQTKILIASHIVPWRDCTDAERLDPDNGILLTPNVDALFDRNLISFSDTGQIILSDELNKSEYQSLGIDGNETLRKIGSGMIPYLQRHRLKLKRKP